MCACSVGRGRGESNAERQLFAWLQLIAPMAAAGPAQPPVAFEDVALYFTRAEWALLSESEKQLYGDQMQKNYRALASLARPGARAVLPPPPAPAAQARASRRRRQPSEDQEREHVACLRALQWSLKRQKKKWDANLELRRAARRELLEQNRSIYAAFTVAMGHLVAAIERSRSYPPAPAPSQGPPTPAPVSASVSTPAPPASPPSPPSGRQGPRTRSSGTSRGRRRPQP
ncbi:uncharacterized protein LOC102458863 isoform X2 [Pelodiscus sinensis]|uniref:uncharacterized protein LOC102458863 isoform X2 n=1 Tax=Pelodiscus sinensis TaxID=13735 RepID=UPI003F6C5390